MIEVEEPREPEKKPNKVKVEKSKKMEEFTVTQKNEIPINEPIQ